MALQAPVAEGIRAFRSDDGGELFETLLVRLSTVASASSRLRDLNRLTTMIPRARRTAYIVPDDAPILPQGLRICPGWNFRKGQVLIALDTPKAAALANDILFTAKDCWRNWYNCATKLTLPAEIAIIQKLNK